MPYPVTETVQTDSVPVAATQEHTPAEKNFEAWRTRLTPKSADSAPPVEKQEAVEAESAPATEATGSEPAKDLQDAPRQKTKADTERRFREILDENKQLKQRLDEVERRTAAPRETKQESQPAAETKLDKPKAPRLDDKNADGSWKYTDPSEFYSDLAKYGAQEAVEKYKAESEKSAKERDQQEAQKVVNQRVGERIEKARAKHEDFDAVALNNDLPIKIGTPVDLFLVDSEQGAEVLYYLGQNPEELERIQGKATTTKDANGNVHFTFNGGLHPLAQVRELTKLELQLSEPKDNPAPPKTRAPKPPSEVGGRGTQPADTAQAAVRANDFRAFKAEANRRALATAK